MSGISQESEVASYTVGTAINSLILDYSARVTADDASDYFSTCIKHKVYFYFISTLAYVCRGDDILGEKEKEWIIKSAQAWRVPENEILEALKGKDYSREMVKAATVATKEMIPNASDKDIIERVEPLSYALLMQAIISATQDGIVKQEYMVAKKVGRELGFDNSTVNKMINAVKLEKQLYDQLSEAMKFKQPKNVTLRSKY